MTLGLVTSVLGALWASSAAVGALIKGINVVYGQEENRGFLHRRAVALALTLGGIVVIIATLLLVAVFPVALGWVGLDATGRFVASVARWILLAALLASAVAAFYRYGPSRSRPSWSSVAWGLVVALALWLTASAAFSVYVANFGRYDTLYGSIAAAIVLQLWLFLAAFALLLGAEVNAVLEQRRDCPSTERALADRDE